MKFKIFMNHLSLSGGAEMIAVEGAKKLAKEGHDITICTSINHDCNNIIKQLNLLNIKVLDIGYKNFTFLGDSKNFFQKIHDQILDVYNPFLKIFVKRNISSDDFVIVHKMRTFSPFIFKCLKIVGCKYIYSLHDYEFFSFNAKNPNGKLSKIYFNLLRKKYLKYMDCMTCPSFYVKNVIKRLYPYIELKVLPNFINCRPIEKDDFNNDYEIGFFGRLEYIKGVNYFCELASNLNTQSVVVGEGSLLYELEEKYVENRNIIFLGKQSHTDVLSLMSRCKMILVPSMWSEPFGLVAAEALYMGAHVVVSDQGALPEVVENVGGARTVININDMKDMQVFQKIIENLLKNSSLPEYCKVNDFYSVERYVTDLISIIK